MKLRSRLARWLVGPFVTIPEEEGVWIVQRFEGGWYAVTKAEKFRMRLTTQVAPLTFEPGQTIDWNAQRTTGRFVGTVAL